MKNPNEEVTLRVRLRPTETMSISIPLDTLDTIKRIAGNRDMSVEALLKLYIGQGVRQDAAQLHVDRILEMTAEVLARHIGSHEKVAAILREIRGNAA